MKYLFLLSLVFQFKSLNAQAWKDSLIEARKYYGQKDFGKAFEKYNGLLKIAPKHLDLSDEIAQAAYKAEQYKAAEETYKNRLNQKDVQPKASSYHNMGNSQMKQENYQSAIDSYKNALRLNSSDEETRYNLSEAIRKLKQQEQQDEKNKDQDKKENKQDKQDNQKDKENQSNEKNDGNLPSISDNSVDKILDNLSKQEANTKQKNQEKKKGKGSTSTGKDW